MIVTPTSAAASTGVATSHARDVLQPCRIGCSIQRYDTTAMARVMANCTPISGQPVRPMRSEFAKTSTGQCQRYTP